MPACFNALPGMEVPVGAIARGFDQLWAEPNVSEQKALQLNLVLHLGVATTPTDAVKQFAVAQRFAQRYPCRVVVLCPTESAESPLKIRAKIYGEMEFGTNGTDACMPAVCEWRRSKLKKSTFAGFPSTVIATRG